jgi:hypothetical protein
VTPAEELAALRADLIASGIAPNETTPEQEERLQTLVAQVWEVELEVAQGSAPARRGAVWPGAARSGEARSGEARQSRRG